jgi:hypothetical protein
MAFRCYACMSACGLLYHCLLEEGSLACGLAYAGDMAFTAASCLSIATGQVPNLPTTSLFELCTNPVISYVNIMFVLRVLILNNFVYGVNHALTG